jgi:hypothetical protein
MRDLKAMEKALERLRHQRNYLAGAKAGLERFLPHSATRDNSPSMKMSSHSGKRRTES